MGATYYSLPLPPRRSSASFSSPKIEPRKIRAVIPTYKDWEDLRTTLESLQALNPRLGAITIANDNADNHIPDWLKTYPVELVNYSGNQGAAYARNKGAKHPEPQFDWLYFTDCGCEHVRDLLTHFIKARKSGRDSIVAICGTVAGKGQGRINRYMTEMGILNPPFEEDSGHYDEKIPQAIITANALVYAPAFYQLGGFSIDFMGAGGEDLDLGIRLRDLGRLVYEPQAIVYHKFPENLQDFKNRFERYGKGNRLLEQKHKLPSLRPDPLILQNPEFNDLAELQFDALCSGYDQAKRENVVRFSARALKRVALEILKI